MMDTMARRGPDGAGLWANGATALGHRRLKIIDLSERAQQPMVDPDLGLSVAFNGCIYNYKELRAELEGKGYRFFSDGDTEVVIKAWHAWGKEAPKRFHGMFAFAVDERDSGRLALVRDRLGIKPLYYSEQPGKSIRFASTLPALLAAGDVDTSIDPVALHYYMTFHAVVPPPHTIIKGVRKIEPGTVTVFEPDGRRSTERFWSLSFARTSEETRRSREEWRDAVHAALRTAVDRRMVADVPVGVLLSGGLEFQPDRRPAGGRRPAAPEDLFHRLRIRRRRTGRRIPVFRHHRQAFRHRAPQAVHRIRQADRQPAGNHPGDVGADGLLRQCRLLSAVEGSGAPREGGAVRPGRRRGVRRLSLVSAADQFQRSGRATTPRNFFDRDHAEYARIMEPGVVDGDHALDFVRAHFDKPGADDAVDKALRIDSTIMLVDDPVKRVDNMTMAWGLEARVPFLDHDLVELAAKVPAAEKVRDGGKGVLKDVGRQIIPAEVIDRPKGYFPVPALKYIEGPVLDFVRQALDAPAARQRGLVKREYIDTLLASPKEHITRLRGSKLWQVALLELWLQAHHI